jgi:hypothetical protein
MTTIRKSVLAVFSVFPIRVCPTSDAVDVAIDVDVAVAVVRVTVISNFVGSE